MDFKVLGFIGLRLGAYGFKALSSMGSRFRVYGA